MLILRRTERSDQPEMMHGGITNGGAALAQVCSCVAEGQGRALAAGPLPSCSPCAARKQVIWLPEARRVPAEDAASTCTISITDTVCGKG